MDKYAFSIQERVALWRAWKQRCAYSSQPVAYSDLEIDHVIPEEMLNDAGALAKMLTRLQLPADFNLNSFANWVPTYHGINRQKSSGHLSDQNIRYFLDLARQRLPAVEKEFSRQTRHRRTERHLVEITALVDRGDLSISKIVDYVQHNSHPNVRRAEMGPLVFTAGISNVTLLPGETYAAACGRLEGMLLADMDKQSGFIALTEATERNGESLSARFAGWHVSVEAVLSALKQPWELLEIAPFGEVYEGRSPDDLYAEAVAQRHRENISDESDPIFGLGKCPACGSGPLERSSHTDYNADEQVYIVRCGSCGWSDWSN